MELCQGLLCHLPFLPNEKNTGNWLNIFSSGDKNFIHIFWALLAYMKKTLKFGERFLKARGGPVC